VCEGARQWLAKEMANLKEVRKGCLTVRTGGVLAHSCLLVWVGTMSLHTPPPSPSTNPYLWSISNMPYYSNMQLL
jgi:hypothetical protein